MMTNDPYVISAAPSGTLSTLTNGEANVPGAVETRYDGTGRVVASITESLGARSGAPARPTAVITPTPPRRPVGPHPPRTSTREATQSSCSNTTAERRPASVRRPTTTRRATPTGRPASARA